MGLSWDAAAGAETYNVYRDTTSGVDASGSPLEEGISETALSSSYRAAQKMTFAAATLLCHP